MRKLGLLLVLAALPLVAQKPLPQARTKYVTDSAGVLDDARESALNERLAQHERDSAILFLFTRSAGLRRDSAAPRACSG